ncbi:MAG: hypothetical protein OXE59_05870 [Bacteroidetes bacterium]|nr:hypothetical protein [Bacteroidota bacterium]MCY4233252.1 hypothetical protein [Bacteroidota bacterium]
MIWVIVPIVAILAPFCYSAYAKWVNLQKIRAKGSLPDEYENRLAQTEDELEVAKQRIENLESIVVSKLLDDPSKKEAISIDESDLIQRKVER